MTRLARAAERYFRRVASKPDGAVVHYGDCSFFDVQICDCGLLQTLIPHASRENVRTIYPKFWREWGQHQAQIDKLQNEKLQRSC